MTEVDAVVYQYSNFIKKIIQFIDNFHINSTLEWKCYTIDTIVRMMWLEMIKIFFF